MNALFLGGESLRNKDWIESVAKEFKPMFDELKVHYYEHWQTGEGGISLAVEQPRLAESANGLENYIVFAKSAGAVLSVKSISDGSLRPVKCVFCGTALVMVEKNNLDFASWLKAVKAPILFIQNSDDPVASFDNLKAYVVSAEIPDCQFVELPGDTHDYTDLTKLKSLVQEFVLK